jgi:hypothetical protein
VLTDPVTLPIVNVTGGGSVGGLLQAGTYYLKYTFVNAAGETLASPSSSAFTVASGNIPQVTLPALPTGATSINIYLTVAGGVSGTETLYKTGVTGTTTLLDTATTAGPVIYAVLTNSGSSYVSAPTVSFSGGGGSGAAATATVAGGLVTGVVITAGGSGYTSAPTISFSSGGGTGAAAVAHISTTETFTPNVNTTNTLITSIWTATTRTLSAFGFNVTVGSNTDKTGYSLAATGMDAIAVTDPGAITNMTTLPKLIVALWRYFYKKTTATSTQLKTYNDDNATVNTTMALSNDGTTQTKGAGA